MIVYQDEDKAWPRQYHPGYGDFPNSGFSSPYDLIAENQWVEAHPDREVPMWIPPDGDWPEE